MGDLETWLLGIAESPIKTMPALKIFIFPLGTVRDSAVKIIMVGQELVKVMSQAGFQEGKAARGEKSGF
jgi:hypothetical protein